MRPSNAKPDNQGTLAPVLESKPLRLIDVIKRILERDDDDE